MIWDFRLLLVTDENKSKGYNEISSRGSKQHNGHELSLLAVSSRSGQWARLQMLREFQTPKDRNVEFAEGQYDS